MVGERRCLAYIPQFEADWAASKKKIFAKLLYFSGLKAGGC